MSSHFLPFWDTIYSDQNNDERPPWLQWGGHLVLFVASGGSGSLARVIRQFLCGLQLS